MQHYRDLVKSSATRVNGQVFSDKECHLKALELDEGLASAWHNLGVAGGGFLNGHFFNSQRCHLNALRSELEAKQRKAQEGANIEQKAAVDAEWQQKTENQKTDAVSMLCATFCSLTEGADQCLDDVS